MSNFVGISQGQAAGSGGGRKLSVSNLIPAFRALSTVLIPVFHGTYPYFPRLVRGIYPNMGTMLEQGMDPRLRGDGSKSLD